MSEWLKFTEAGPSTALQNTPSFVGGDILAKPIQPLTPVDFRLAKGSPGQGVLPSGKDLGADVDFVGPGAGYERWQKTPAYQAWRKLTEELMTTK